jgi:lipopolysaccharide assembly outer membrane protein LptD (OstA)
VKVWRGPSRGLVLAGVLLLSASVPGAEEEPARTGTGPDRKGYSQPGEEGGKSLEVTAGAGSVFGKDELLLRDYVDIRYGDLRLQADSVRYLPATREAFAEGNVVVDHGPTRITAARVEYNLDTGRGTFYEARGYAEPSFYFEAAELQKVEDDRYVLVDATFTTCTQPLPYWSFRIARGTIHLDHYAYLHHVSFRAEKLPLFYSPYLVWPIKEDRATGLLFPEFGYSRRRGFVLSNAFYWAIRRNMDATFFLDYYALAGLGEGIEYRYVPSARGKGQLTGSFIRDQVTDMDRYFVNLNHRQDFGEDFRLVASFNQVSDFDYFPDFQRDLRLSTNPVVLSSLYLSRNWSAYALNLRAERRRQIFSVTRQFFPVGTAPAFTRTEEEELTNLIQPKFEIRGSRQRLGSSPLYFAFDTSLDSFHKETALLTANYQRFDLFPSFSAPLRLAPWLDVNPTVSLRDTYYTHRLGGILTEDLNGNGVPDPGEDLGLDGLAGTGDSGEGNGILDRQQEILDRDFVRKVLQGSVEIIGPKLSRVFVRPESSFSPAYKNTIEPRLFYLYQSKVDDPQLVIPFDEKDGIAGNQNSLQYSITTRLFARRPGITPRAPEPETGLSLPDLLSGPPGEGKSLPAPPQQGPEEKPSLSPVEIASFQISQSYSFLGPLSQMGPCIFVDGTPTGAGCVTSRFSSVDAQLRFNPTLHSSLDLRTNYDILFNEFRGASLSANFRNSERGFLDLTWFFQNSLEGGPDRSQIGVLTETALANRKLLLGFQGNYDLEARELQNHRYKIGYTTQCCGFTFEILDRSFQGVSQQEFRFLVNLKGIGNVLDINSGSSAIPTVPINF